MDRMITISRNRNVVNLEVGVSGLKMENATPRKAGALKDLTNKTGNSENYNTPARKGPNIIPMSSNVMKSFSVKKNMGEEESAAMLKDYFYAKLSETPCLEYEAQTFPAKKNCKCCSNERKSDEELWGDAYGMQQETIDALINPSLVFHETSSDSTLLKFDVPSLIPEPEEESHANEKYLFNPLFPLPEWEDSLKDSSSFLIDDDEEMSDSSILSDWTLETCGASKTECSFNDSIF